jgi:Family of unknown function (DUF6247)
MSNGEWSWQRLLIAMTWGAVHNLLDYWRRIARLTMRLGHDGYRQMLKQAERTLRIGEMPADPVPIEEIRFRLAARIAAGPR